MADTVPNITLLPNVWTDANAATSIPVGTAVKVQNRGSYPVQVYVGVSQPDSSDGDQLLSPFGIYGSWLQASAGENNIWLKCQNECEVSFQE